MLCITKVEVMNIKHPTYAEFMRCKMEDPLAMKPGIEEYFEWEREMVNGTIFMNAKGERICIGASKEVEEALGLPFEVFKEQDKIINQQRKTIESLHNYHRMWSHMSPWNMVKHATRRWWDLKRGMVI